MEWRDSNAKVRKNSLSTDVSFFLWRSAERARSARRNIYFLVYSPPPPPPPSPPCVPGHYSPAVFIFVRALDDDLRKQKVWEQTSTKIKRRWERDGNAPHPPGGTQQNLCEEAPPWDPIPLRYAQDWTLLRNLRKPQKFVIFNWVLKNYCIVLFPRT